ncbi:thioredoxin-like fold domain-containing protein MRL7L, chloroplastic [Trifolium pratense]|uniref:thioredoxin-like fold domain-containing protein MRL7L, chloroplastic n=1 Tax=Trifolium pratense TaxID=57577 RepID=UPI001E69147F|nr:thioredoxin-like fold domain-containing protein MRL7L, chloroplastic [Trifolium pratense]
MALSFPLSSFISPIKDTNFNFPNSFSLYKYKPTKNIFNFSNPSLQVGYSRVTRVQVLKSDGAGSNRRGRERYSDSDSDDEDEDDAPSPSKENDPYAMNLEERQEWRRKIRQVMDKKPDIQEVVDNDEKKKKMEKLINDYGLVVEEEDPNWPEDADGWGFSFGQFFDKITVQNKKKEDNDDVEDDNDVDDDKPIVWQDDNYIRPIKDIKAAEWEETVFKDISPLIILVHNRYKRPKDNERIRDELEKAVHIIWNCRLPSPRCVALDAVVETELVAALKVSVFPEVIFTKAGKILFRDKAIRSGDEWSKIMAFFYYRGAKPPCLTNIPDFQENIPSFTIGNRVS